VPLFFAYLLRSAVLVGALRFSLRAAAIGRGGAVADEAAASRLC
jgi:hypothetical protein